jgi:ribosomal protein S18 acetylase RimI-like enzyme
MTVRIRPARLADLPRLQDIFRRASLSNERDRPALLDNPDVLVLEPDPVASGLTRVAERPDGEILGFALVETTGSAAELVDLFVDPDAMRRGVARALIADAVSGLAASDVAELLVTANEHALDFYRAVGFETVGIATTEFGPGIRMRRNTSV